MNKPFVQISSDSSFSKSQLDELGNLFVDFEIETHRWGMKAGTIDLLTVLEISLGFALAQYFAGLISEAGKSTWKSISSGLSNFLRKNNRRKDVTALVFYANEIPIYVVERFHEDDAESLIESIPFALLKVKKFLENLGLLKDTMMMQLFQHPQSKEWKYLIVPSTKAFGAFADRIIDLDSFEFYYPRNHQDFIERFCGICNGKHCLICARYYLNKILNS